MNGAQGEVKARAPPAEGRLLRWLRIAAITRHTGAFQRTRYAIERRCSFSRMKVSSTVLLIPQEAAKSSFPQILLRCLQDEMTVSEWGASIDAQNQTRDGASSDPSSNRMGNTPTTPEDPSKDGFFESVTSSLVHCNIDI